LIRKSLSQALIIFNSTFVPDGHLIKFTASVTVRSCREFPFASTTISHLRIQNSKAGDHFITLSIITQSSCFSTTAPIHSKSQESASLNCLFSSGVKNSLNLSHKEFTNH